MYRREEASQLRHEFWTTFGKYMSPVPSADGLKINWINYKTGFKDVQFRMVTAKKSAITGIYLMHRDAELQEIFYEKFLSLQKPLMDITGINWKWQLHIADENNKTISRIYDEKNGISIFNKDHWPQLITFFKSHIMALDEFWSMARVSFDQLK